jgi:hypothetical protein
MMEDLIFIFFRTCRQLGGPNLPKIDDCLAETDPCNVNFIFNFTFYKLVIVEQKDE